jgi:integrase
LAYLRKALALAAGDWELRPDNPAAQIQAYPEPKRERHFSDDDLARIGADLAAMEQEDVILPGAARLIRILALTGMRLGEALGLRWAWIEVNAACIRLPDAKAGARAVPLGAVALVYLSGLERIGPFVCFGVEPDRPVGHKTFRRAWAELVRRTGIVGARPHDFRHTAGTFAAATGANAFIIRDLMGHKTLAMTGKYVERTIDPLRGTADAVASRVHAAMELHTTIQKRKPGISRLEPINSAKL